MQTYQFDIPAHSTQRNWAVYAIVALDLKTQNKLLYVGKVGDNRAGCNPMISRIGNHFSFNKIHSQFRNYLDKFDRNPDQFDYSVHYLAIEPYEQSTHENLREIINEAERFLNLTIQNHNLKTLTLLNPFTGKYLSKTESARREKILTKDERKEIVEFVEEIKKKHCSQQLSSNAAR